MAWGSTVVVPEMGQIRSFLVQPLQLDSSVGVVELVLPPSEQVYIVEIPFRVTVPKHIKYLGHDSPTSRQ